MNLQEKTQINKKILASSHALGACDEAFFFWLVILCCRVIIIIIYIHIYNFYFEILIYKWIKQFKN